MTDIKARFFRRTSVISSAKSSASSLASGVGAGDTRSRSKSSLLLSKNRKLSLGEPVHAEEKESTRHHPDAAPAAESPPVTADSQQTFHTSVETPPSPLEEKNQPALTLQTPTPDPVGSSTNAVDQAYRSEGTTYDLSDPNARTDLVPPRPEAPRRQSLAHSSQTRFLKTLLEIDKPQPRTPNTDYFGGPPTISANMLHRKIWVKRPGASATLVSINEDDLVDDVRDMILRKYANSLGRSFDAPDVTLRIVPREHSHRQSQGGERTLGPEEPISRTLDAYFPGGQTVDEALLIDVPQRRTPRHSPRNVVPYYLAEDFRPGESGTDYFPPMPATGQHSPHLSSSLSIASGQSGSHHQPLHSIAVLNSGQIAPLPSPSLRNPRHPQHAQHAHRPKYGRTHTSSPTVVSGASVPQSHENLKTHANGIPTAPPLPTPPLPLDVQPHRTATPPPRTLSPRPNAPPHKRSKKPLEHPKLPAGLLDGAVPPINVLIVEDNIINLKLLEAFMKRLKVRWHTAMNGRDAVTKWRAGGFHLVLMDIQLPVMNGLDATKEIRRLERLNNIGVFSNSASSAPTFSPCIENGENAATAEGEDSLMNTGMFKSPVIIVALTASSLQSDRHEALAAGCNDFLTKPVNFVWLERKVMEWGCMQALIDFDGWRKWKDFSQQNQAFGPGKVTNNHAHKGSVAGATKGSGVGGANTAAKLALVSKRDKRLSASTTGTGTSDSSRSEVVDGDRDGGRGTPMVAVA